MHRVVILLTGDERHELKRRAADDGLPVGAFVRQHLFHRVSPPLPPPPALAPAPEPEPDTDVSEQELRTGQLRLTMACAQGIGELQRDQDELRAAVEDIQRVTGRMASILDELA